MLEFSADWKQIDCQHKETLIIIKVFPLLQDMQLFNNKPGLVVQGMMSMFWISLYLPLHIGVTRDPSFE